MDKKEFAVGERFQCGLITLEVKETQLLCSGCFFRGFDCSDIETLVGRCEGLYRTDNKEVIFKQVKE